MSPLNVLFMLFWRCVCGASLALFLHLWLNCGEYICFSTLGTCTPCYVFITLFLCALGIHQFFQSQPNQNKYIQETLDDSNTKQQGPEMEKETVDVEMCEEPRTDEDAPMGSSLRQSS